MATLSDSTSIEVLPPPQVKPARVRPRLLTVLVPLCCAALMIGAMGTWTQNAAGKPLIVGRDSGIGWITLVQGLTALVLSLTAVFRRRDRWLLPTIFVLALAALFTVSVALVMTDGSQTTGNGVAIAVISAFLGVLLSTLQLVLRLAIGLTRRIVRTVHANRVMRRTVS